jgi:hypothetical protein
LRDKGEIAKSHELLRVLRLWPKRSKLADEAFTEISLGHDGSRGNPKGQRRVSPFMAIGNQLAMTCPSYPVALMAIA